MGSAAALVDSVPQGRASSGKRKAKSEHDLQRSKSKKQKSGEESAATRKMPKRSAACSSFKEKSVRLLNDVIETKKDRQVDEEIVAVGLTSGHDEERPNRRLSDFIFHDLDGKSQQIEMLEVDDLYVSGVVLPGSETHDEEKDKGVRCEGFGRIELWSISGYEDGYPVVWVSTDICDYECLKPAGCFKKFYDQFFEKARVCVEVYKKLSKAAGGNPDTGLDELLAGVIRSMNGSKHFNTANSIRDFVVSQGSFIYDQLIGLDETSKQNDVKFADLPVLFSLKEESSITSNGFQSNGVTIGGSLKIHSSPRGRKKKPSLSGANLEDESVKLAKILHEEEYWKSMKQKRNQSSASNMNKFYIKINEDEIANDYPLPAYYKTSDQETDEYVVFDNDHALYEIDELPRSMLHNWSLYNSDSRLISLELLPMKPCADIDVSIFGSGVMTSDDGSGFCLDDDPSVSSSGSSACDVDGMPIFLSSVKEWMIEFGSSMVFISIRTDMAWYRLGKPSKQYAPWYKTVLKTAKLAISIITMLKEQNRVSRLSFSDVVKRVSEFGKDHPAYVSCSIDAVERYIVVHGQIILQQFSEFPDENIKKCSFVIGLSSKMEERHHTKWVMKKKKVLQKIQPNLNPRALIQPITSKKKLMQATTTRLINRIWGEYYSNYSPENRDDAMPCEVKEDDNVDEQDENEEDDVIEVKPLSKKTEKPRSASLRSKACGNSKDIKWEGGSVGKTSSGWTLFKKAVVRGSVVSVGGSVYIEHDKSDEFSCIYFVEYMFETPNGSKMFHGRKMQRGSDTVLGNTANEREVFLTSECLDFELGGVEVVVVELRLRPWGHQYRKDYIDSDRVDREKAEERKRKGLPVEYYCKNMYCPEKGAFISIHSDSIGLGSGTCESCKMKEAEEAMEKFRVNSGKSDFVYNGVEYAIKDFVYISPHRFASEKIEGETFKGGRNVGLKAFVVCQLLELLPSKAAREPDPSSIQIKVRRFFRPEDISDEKAYSSDIREVYYSEEMQILSIEEIEGKCEVRKKQDLSSSDSPSIFNHVFFCEYTYDPSKGSLRKLPAQVKICYSKQKMVGDAISRREKGKCKEGEDSQESNGEVAKNQLATLDIFSGCGGLSEGLEKSGASQTKWAIEYEEPAGDAFKLNHPEALVFVKNCNVILKAVIDKCGDSYDCISTPEAAELAASMSEQELSHLPLPGQVDFINGGPPCQGFSGMNRFNQSAWSKVQCEMILGFLSFADYFRPKYFLLENVRNFVSFNKGQTFRLTLASLLEIGYQVRFGILEAGTYGVSQSRKRAFIWAASPHETLPEWPEPMHVFSAPELRITLSPNEQYAAARSTAAGAPFRAITVRDSIGDLPPVGNGASNANLEYQNEPVSWFQKKIRGDSTVLTDHISKEMNELNIIRCQRIPKRAGADWHDLPEEKVKLSSGEVADLIPWCLPNTAERHNQWKGLFGRLDWEGNFPTSITDPQPMGKVGMCFHPEQDRIITVRECARSQGFPDSYKFSGIIQHKHRQIGNAVPPPLAFALGRKLKEAVDGKCAAAK